MSELFDTYYIIEKSGEGLYKEKGSKFIAHTFHVLSEEEIQDRLLELRKKYYDARHHCYAWMLGESYERSRANDDGEPSNSAGMPILNQIKSFQLTNVLVVVIRYFGGTKLGVSGLIQAYKESANEALQLSGKIECYRQMQLDFSMSYESVNDAMRIVKDLSLHVVEQKFTDQGLELKISVRLKDVQKTLDRFEEYHKIQRIDKEL